MNAAPFKNHYLLQTRGTGLSRRMRGKVLVELIYVSDANSSWTQDEKTGFRNALSTAMKLLYSQAVAAGVNVHFSALANDYFFSRETAPSNISNVPRFVFNDYLKKQGFSDIDSFVRSRKTAYNMDEVTVILAIDEKFRPQAIHSLSSDVEYALLPKVIDVPTIAHEVLHTFGASDLYFPYHISELAMKYFPQSIMLGEDRTEVDPLTQFLIGWTDKLSSKACDFLSRTADLTVQRARIANNLNMSRGQEEGMIRKVAPYKSIGELVQKAEDEDPWAEYLLGICMKDGICMAKNPSQAEALFKRSARAGILLAASAYAQMLLCRKSLTKLDLEELEMILFGHGFRDIKINNLAVACLYNGFVFPKNQEYAVQQALRLYNNKSQDLGTPHSTVPLFKIATRYCVHIKELYTAVSKLRSDYETMLEEGDPDLQYFIACQKVQGTYIPRDLTGAYNLYNRSANKGNYLACEALVRGYKMGYWKDVAPALLHTWTTMATKARAQDPNAFCILMES